MFCPSCRDEFRAGFVRCERCRVDLVDDLSHLPEAEPERPAAPHAFVSVVDYCGFLSLEDARAARDKLRALQIRTDIVIREPVDASLGEPIEEEYWIRIDPSRARDVRAAIGAPEPSEPESSAGGFACSVCGAHVQEDESFCPKCGARFEDD